LKIFADKEIRS